MKRINRLLFWIGLLSLGACSTGKEQIARQIQALKAQVQTEVKTTFQEFRMMRELVKSIERELLKPAEQARDASAYVYHGKGSSRIEFLDAQRAFNEMMQSYYEAESSYRRALIQFYPRWARRSYVDV